MNRLSTFLWGMITLLLFSNVMGQKFLPQPEIEASMKTHRDWYNKDTRKYLFSYLYVNRSNPNPEKAENVYDYVRLEREFKVRDNGTKFIRWYLDFNAKRPHPQKYGANFYGILLGSSVGKIHNLHYRVYDGNGNLLPEQSYDGDNVKGGVPGVGAPGWGDNGQTKFYFSAEDGQKVNISTNFWRHIVWNNSHASYEGSWAYTKHQVHNAKAQLIKHGQDADNNPGKGQIIINQGRTQSDEYRYVYQFDTDIVDDTKDHHYVAFHNIDNNNYGSHLLAFLPPEDGQPDTKVYKQPVPKQIITNVGVIPDVKTGISNLSDFPADAEWSWVNAPDVSKEGDVQGKAKVTYKLGNEPVYMEVLIPVKVIDVKKDKDIYPAIGETVRLLIGEDVTNKAHEFVSFPANIPADKRPDNNNIVWKTTPTIQRGKQSGQVEITYKDGSKAIVDVVADVVGVPAQNLVQIVRGTSETIAKDIVKVGTNRGVSSWRYIDPIVKTVPSTATKRTYTGNEGALVMITNSEDVNNRKILSASSLSGVSYKIENGKISIESDVRVPVEIIDNQADVHNPIGKTIRLLNGEDIDDNAHDFVNLPNAPQGTKYVWKTKPNTNQPTLTQRKQETGVVEVQYPDGSKEDVTVTADVVPVPPQNTRAYILQHSLEDNAKNKIQAVTNRPAAWASGKNPEVVSSIDTSVVGDFNATVSIENKFSVNTGIITGASSIAGTTYSKPTAELTSIVTNVSVPYTIINKPVLIDNTPLVVEVGSGINNNDLLAKIGNKQGWEVVSITPPDTNSIGNKTATVVLRHPNLPASDNQTFTIPVEVIAKPFCVKPANTTGTGLNTNFGITDLGRAGETTNSWPMLRKGGWVALESNDKGFVITRMTTAQINNLTAQEGMMVYDTDAKCLKIYDGTKWACFSTPACPTN